MDEKQKIAHLKGGRYVEGMTVSEFMTYLTVCA